MALSGSGSACRRTVFHRLAYLKRVPTHHGCSAVSISSSNAFSQGSLMTDADDMPSRARTLYAAVNFCSLFSFSSDALRRQRKVFLVPFAPSLHLCGKRAKQLIYRRRTALLDRMFLAPLNCITQKKMATETPLRQCPHPLNRQDNGHMKSTTWHCKIRIFLAYSSQTL